MTTNSAAITWFIVGLLLVVVEFFAPQLILIFFGAAAIITGGLVLCGLPQQTGIPFAVFAGTSVILLVTLRKLAKRLFQGFTSDVTKTEPGFDDIVGCEAVVVSGFGTGLLRGRVSFRGAEWDAVSRHPLSHGNRVKILGRDGHNLRIEII